MNIFAYRFTRQCIVPGIILGVFSFIVFYVLDALGLIEVDHGRTAGLLTFNVAPFMIIASVSAVRIMLRTQKGSPDVSPSIATFLTYSIFSLAYIMLWAMKIQSSHDEGPFMTGWAFVGMEILIGLSVCWLIYWLVLLCRSVYHSGSVKKCMKLTLVSVMKAFGLFLLFNVLPLFLFLFFWPLLIILAGKIVSFFS